MVSVNANGPIPIYGAGTWELNYVRFGTTLPIGAGQTFSSLAQAWSYAQNAHIADGAYLHFAIVTSNGNHTETFSSALSVDHDAGALISITGDNASRINLQFPNSSGITIDSGHSLASISGVTISGAGANTSNNSDGIYATRNATISSISDCNITSFNYGVVADYGATVALVSPTTVKECINGIQADHNATVSTVGATIALSTPQSSGINAHGLWAEDGGLIEGDDCTLSNSATGYGIGAVTVQRGVIDISYASVSGWQIGVLAEYAGFVVIQGAAFSKNLTDVGVYEGGQVNANGLSSLTTESDTGLGSYIYY
jgi:hypothetical protein